MDEERQVLLKFVEWLATELREVQGVDVSHLDLSVERYLKAKEVANGTG